MRGRGATTNGRDGWAAVTLLLWIVGFPAYVIKRGALIEAAKASPVEVKNRAIGFVGLAFFGGAWLFLAIAGYAAGALPQCDSKEVARVLDGIPAVQAAATAGARLSDPGEASYDAQGEKRTCRAILRKGSDQLPVTFSVTWHNKSQGQIWVAIVE
jgi:hypothetical protein